MLKQCRKVQYLVIGGGYAGMNALAGLKTLGNVNSALCVDKNEAPGGSWHHFYSHVRLHTNHRVFGVNMHPWEGVDPRYRASRDQVLHHFGSFVRDGLPKGFHYQGNTKFESVSRDGTYKVRLKTTEGDEIVEADHVIDARGFNYTSHMTKAQDPLTDKDSQEEVEIKDLDTVLSEPGPPEGRLIVVIGGGLTGIDAAKYSVENKDSNDEVLLITGRSKFFFSREWSTPPVPMSRKSLAENFLDMALMFDGTNGLEVLRKKEEAGFLRRLADDPAQGLLFGVIAEEQTKFTNDNCQIIANDHFIRCDESGVHLKSGKHIKTQKQIVIVNCRSSIQMSDSPFTKNLPPITSDGILRIGSQLGFTGPTAYLFTMLYGLGKFENIQQWGMGDCSMMKFDANDSCKFLLKVTANTIVIMNNLPFKLVRTFKLSGDQLVPLPRRLYSLAKLTRSKQKLLEKADELLLSL